MGGRRPPDQLSSLTGTASILELPALKGEPGTGFEEPERTVLASRERAAASSAAFPPSNMLGLRPWHPKCSEYTGGGSGPHGSP